MWQEVREKLQSPARGVRMQGWRQLHEAYAASQKPPTMRQRTWLCEQLLDEEDDGVWRLGITILQGVPWPAPAASSSVPVPAAPPPPPPPPPSPAPAAASADKAAPSLADWLWEPFHKPSAVFGVSAPRFRLRDEPALIVLARRLSRDEFPHTDIHLIPREEPEPASSDAVEGPEEPHWTRLLLERRHQCLCLVGRLGLYGSEAVERWGNSDARFGFLQELRPPDLPRGQLDPDYHCIVERRGGRPVPDYPPYRTEDHKDAQGRRVQRTDFGLVQRYTVFDGVRTVVVVTCAGGSALGTLAAAQWAAEVLPGPTHPYEEIPLPPPAAIGPDSTLEALVDVTAPLTTHAWEPSRIQLRRLHVDRMVWSSEDRKWHVDAPVVITLIERDGETVSILFDGDRVPLQHGSQTFRLLDALCRQALRSPGGLIDVGRLAADVRIWGGRRLQESEVRRRLATLKHRYLGDALLIDREVRLLAQVLVQAG